jgi:hypothetical protein
MYVRACTQVSHTTTLSCAAYWVAVCVYVCTCSNSLLQNMVGAKLLGWAPKSFTCDTENEHIHNKHQALECERGACYVRKLCNHELYTAIHPTGLNDSYNLLYHAVSCVIYFYHTIEVHSIVCYKLYIVD